MLLLPLLDRIASLVSLKLVVTPVCTVSTLVLPPIVTSRIAMTPIMSESWPCTYAVPIIHKVVTTLHEGKNSLYYSNTYASCRHVIITVFYFAPEFTSENCVCVRESARLRENSYLIQNGVWFSLHVSTARACSCVHAARASQQFSYSL